MFFHGKNSSYPRSSKKSGSKTALAQEHGEKYFTSNAGLIKEGRSWKLDARFTYYLRDDLDMNGYGERQPNQPYFAPAAK